MLNKIGFIGTGIMGTPIVRNLLQKGFNVTVYNRSQQKAHLLEKDGAIFADSIKVCVKDKDVVMTMVGYPQDVKEVYDKVLKYVDHTLLIDMTTSSPDLAKALYDKAKEKNCQMLDAPVTGGDIGAQKGMLTILCGGDQDAFNKAYPLFEAIGSNIYYLGPCGNGQHCKMCNQIAIAGALSGAVEAISYADRMGLDKNQVMEAISAGAAGSFQLSNVAVKAISGDFQPGFIMKHFVKDMGIADEAALSQDLRLEILEHVKKMCISLDDQDLGTQSLLKYYESVR